MAKISVNQLTKFLVSNSANHRAIIKAQLEQKPYMAAYYEKAQKAITQFLLNEFHDEEIIVRAIEKLQSVVPNSDQEAARINNNVEAMDSFLIMYDEIKIFDNCRLSAVTAPCPKVIVSDVEISVFPDCIITGSHKGKKVIGAIKLYFSKPDPLSKDMSATITVLTKRFLEENYQETGTVMNQMCQVVDVFKKTVHSAPSSHIRKMNEISTACEEIKFWWDRLTNEANNQPDT